MKNFDEWWDNNDDWLLQGLCRNHDIQPVADAAEEAWKAALEWVLDKASKLNTSSIGLDVITLFDMVSEELDDEKL